MKWPITHEGWGRYDLHPFINNYLLLIDTVLRKKSYNDDTINNDHTEWLVGYSDVSIEMLGS